jgi:hypothetical protein
VNVDPQTLAASLRRLAGSSDGQDVLGALRGSVEACVDLFGVSGSGLMVADEQNVLRYLISTDGPGRILEEVETEAGEGPCVDAFITNRVVASDDLATETRWAAITPTVLRHGVHSVLGAWDESERQALLRYREVVGTILSTALTARHAGQLADQLQYALDYRVVIERGVGYLMARDGVDAVRAFDRLRRAARANRLKIGEVAQQVLDTGALPGDAGPRP